jgi:hypothetical protein
MQPQNWNVLLSYFMYMYCRGIMSVENSSFTLNDCFVYDLDTQKFVDINVEVSWHYFYGKQN